MKEYNTIESLTREMLTPGCSTQRIRFCKREIVRLRKKQKAEATQSGSKGPGSRGR